MSNPYGITEVDIPGILGAYETGQNNRTRRMMVQQQIEAAERSADRQQRFDEILLNGVSRGGGKQSPAGGAYGMPNVATQTPQQYGQSFATGVTGEAQPAAPAQAPSTAFQLSPETMAQLAYLNPEQASQIATALRTMDTAQAERLQRANLYMANSAQHLLANVPEQQWASEIQRMTPDLLAHGISQQMIAGFVPTRQNLQGVIMQAMDVAHLAEVANPHPVVEPQGGRIIDTNRRDADGNPVVVSESPTVVVGGEVYARPQEMRSRPQAFRDGETRVINGVTYTRQGGVWRATGSGPAPSATQTGAAPDWPIPGGAASVPRNFPQ